MERSISCNAGRLAISISDGLYETTDSGPATGQHGEGNREVSGAVFGMCMACAEDEHAYRGQQEDVMETLGALIRRSRAHQTR